MTGFENLTLFVSEGNPREQRTALKDGVNRLSLGRSLKADIPSRFLAHPLYPLATFGMLSVS